MTVLQGGVVLLRYAVKNGYSPESPKIRGTRGIFAAFLCHSPTGECRQAGPFDMCNVI